MEHIVSVIIPCYNSGETLQLAVESALMQEVPVEVIVVDDCSEIPVRDTLSDFAGDRRLRILRNEKNMGVARSRNRGIQAAGGSFLAFLDADDWWEMGKLAAQLEAMKKEHVLLSCTARELMRADGSSTGKVIPVPERITYEDLLKGNPINCSSVLVAAKAARDFPMDHDDAHEDYIMWLRILKKYKAAVGINYPYLKYRLSENSKSGSKWKSAGMTYKVYRYMGFSHLKSIRCFIAYAVNGVKKYR